MCGHSPAPRPETARPGLLGGGTQTVLRDVPDRGRRAHAAAAQVALVGSGKGAGTGCARDFPVWARPNPVSTIQRPGLTIERAISGDPGQHRRIASGGTPHPAVPMHVLKPSCGLLTDQGRRRAHAAGDHQGVPRHKASRALFNPRAAQ